MIAYVLSHKDLSISDIMEYDSYDLRTDVNFDDKSTIRVAKQPNIEADDFVVCKDGNEIEFIGICENYSASTGSGYTITMRQKECLFDRTMIAGTAMDSMNDPAVGIEGCIANMINAGWALNTDPMLSRS